MQERIAARYPGTKLTMTEYNFGTGDHIRVSYATSKDELDRGLERMRKFFAAL